MKGACGALGRAKARPYKLGDGLAQFASENVETTKYWVRTDIGIGNGERGDGAGAIAGAVDGDFARRDCGRRITAGGAGRRADSRTRRKCRGRGDRYQRSDGLGRADDERNRRGGIFRWVCNGGPTDRLE